MAAPQKLSQPDQRQVAWDYSHGRKVREIAAEFGISAGTVRAIIVRQNGALRKVGRPVQV